MSELCVVVEEPGVKLAYTFPHAAVLVMLTCTVEPVARADGSVVELSRTEGGLLVGGFTDVLRTEHTPDDETRSVADSPAMSLENFRKLNVYSPVRQLGPKSSAEIVCVNVFPLLLRMKYW